MVANLDTTNGVTAFIDSQSDAWHQLGQSVGRSFTAEEAMTEGLLGGWNTRKAPLWADTEAGSLHVPGKYAVLRTNPVAPTQTDVLGVVGNAYKVIQNEEHAALLNALVDESGAHFETAGSLDGGRKVFITMKLPEHMLIGGKDQVDTYIAAVNSHDGSTPFTIMTTPVRIVCQNTLNMATGAASNMFRVRHSSGAEKIIRAEARQALELTFKFLGSFQEEAEKMIQTTLTDAAFAEIVLKEFGPSEDAAKGTVTRSMAKVEEMVALFTSAATQAEVRNTVWAGYNAMTEWADHMAPTRGDEREDARAMNAILRPELKIRARELMMALV